MNTLPRQNFTQDMKKAGMDAFFEICNKWGLKSAQSRALLGFPPESTFYKWKRGDVRTVQHDTMKRISYVLGIFKALQYLFTRPSHADTWVKKPNAHFNGQSALDRMLGGDVVDLAAVRSYLDSYRGGQ